MLDELKGKAEELMNKPEVKDAINKAKDFANSEKGQEMIGKAKDLAAGAKDKIEGFLHKK